MYIALASVSIDLYSPLPNWDTVLLKLSIAFEKLPFDCLNKSLNSCLKEACPFASWKSSFYSFYSIFCAIDNFFSMCFFWTINFGTLLILPCLHFLLLFSCNCESTSTDFKFKLSDFRFKLSCCLCLVPQWLFQNYLPSLPLKMIHEIFHLDQLVNNHFP